MDSASASSIPSLVEAKALLKDAGLRNPGPWVAHSLKVAEAAEIIADKISYMDGQKAYILACLHDIGRRVGVTGMRHAIDGYQFLHKLGFDDPARICITHSYPFKSAAAGSGEWDGTEAEYNFVQNYLDRIEYDAYDRLIQLCDSIALPTGFCLMEKRLVDVVRRYGFNDYTLRKWNAFFEVKADFDHAVGGSVYTLLPGIESTTFAV